ncbi:MAG: peptide ABC transporter substrate-binding protein [Candidatus Saccharimonadales bacterium]
MDPNAPQWKKFVRIKRPTVKHVRVRARKIEGATMRHAHRFIISRWANLRDVRRHAFGWLVLAALLIVATSIQLYWVQNAHSARQAVDGGTYAEGVIGRLDTLNPIYASTQSERSASYLLFSSLLRYDRENNLESDLAQSWKVSADGKAYTVVLREDALWHDGKPVTADDIVFTLKLIKNPQTRSNLYRTWQDIAVKAVSKYEVEFTLPSAYAPFPHALTFGILPEHMLENVSPARLREHPFNRDPVGSGPFEFKSIQIINPDADRVVLQAERNEAYYRGPVKLDRYQLHTFQDHDDLRQGFMSREINAATELTQSDIRTIVDQLPTSIVNDAPLYNGTYAFFQTDRPILSDQAVRKALLKATDRRAIQKDVADYASALDGPLLPEQIRGISDLKQAPYDTAGAKADLEAAGWVLKNGTVREKDGQALQLSVIAPRSGDFPEVLEAISKQWRSVGVDVKTQVVDTKTFEQNILTPRAYDVLIYELALGADPDVFAYWHSSQASVRGFNLSNYKSAVADDALLSARGRSEMDLRSAKYRGFFEQWLRDAPAVALYRPHLRYIATDSSVSVDRDQPVIDTLNRFNNLDDWTVQQGTQFKTP